MPGTTKRFAILAAVAAGVLLVAASMVYPLVTGVDVRVHAPPMHADWGPSFSWRLALPVVVAAAVLAYWRPLTARLQWPAFLAVTFVTAWAWTFTLAIADEGRDGLSRLFDRPGEYVKDAVSVNDVGLMMQEFVSRIPYSSPENWYVHVAGHPPGALLSFVLFDRLGIKDTFWIGFTVMTIGVTAVVAAAIAVRALAGESWARRVAPWWVLWPSAIWMVHADALFTAVSAWGLALLALSATTERSGPRVAWGLGAGLLLGLSVYMSYGLLLLGILALAILFVARKWSPLPWALLGALAVAAGFTVAGYAWWEAYPVLVERYRAGIASERPFSYWAWGNFATLTISAGLAVWAGLPGAATALRRREPVAVLIAAALGTVVLATLTGMSKAEVERIFLPFTLWIAMAPAFLPERWRWPALASQVVIAIAVQCLLIIPVVQLARPN